MRSFPVLVHQGCYGEGKQIRSRMRLPALCKVDKGAGEETAAQEALEMAANEGAATEAVDSVVVELEAVAKGKGVVEKAGVEEA